MFNKYDPYQGKMLQILDADGKISNSEFMPKISNEKVLDAYKLMFYTRTVDLKTVSYQRQGRMYTYPPNLGQEACAVGTGIVLGKEDWLVPSYREMGALLSKGVTAKDIWLYWGGHEDGSRLLQAATVLPVCVPIGTQALHAVGIAHGLKYKKQDAVVFC